MSEMHKIVITDASCFILLDKIGELELLHKLYGTVITTPVIANEYGNVIPDWFIIESAKNSSFQELLELQIDAGESSAIALAIEKTECTIILDDLKARKIAKKLGLKITGTLGVIIKSKLNGIIPSIKPLIAKIKLTDFRISEELEKIALNEAEEEK